MPAVLSAADVATSLFIDLPEMRNNSANKFFDALAAGTPIAINHEGWLADLIRERGLGLVLDPANFTNAALELNGFLRNRERMARAAMSARRAGRELFDRDTLASRLENVLLDATGRAAGKVRGVSELKKAA
jgi:glycosyltransferase involved in cell wall biosynthesis